MAKQCHLTIFLPPSLLGALTREVGITDLWKESRSHQLVVTEWGRGDPLPGPCLAARPTSCLGLPPWGAPSCWPPSLPGSHYIPKRN